MTLQKQIGFQICLSDIFNQEICQHNHLPAHFFKLDVKLVKDKKKDRICLWLRIAGGLLLCLVRD